LAGQGRSRRTRISAENTAESMLLLEKRWTTRAVRRIHAVRAWSRDRAAEWRYDAVRDRA